MIAYMRERHAFGKPISDFGQIQRIVSECYAKYRASRCFLYETLEDLIDGKPRASIDADAVKLCCSEMGEFVSRSAIQVLGANGYSRAYPVERLHRDAVLLSIGGGTNEALQKNLSRLI
jgi:isovaleryl-CoA dehydrogenase